MYSEGRELAVHVDFTFVAIDEDKKPVQVIKLFLMNNQI